MKALDILKDPQSGKIISKGKFYTYNANLINKAISELESLEQQNTELQARIKKLEANEDKLKREWYTIGSDDNYKALLKSGKLR